MKRIIRINTGNEIAYFLKEDGSLSTKREEARVFTDWEDIFKAYAPNPNGKEWDWYFEVVK